MGGPMMGLCGPFCIWCCCGGMGPFGPFGPIELGPPGPMGGGPQGPRPCGGHDHGSGLAQQAAQEHGGGRGG